MSISETLIAKEEGREVAQEDYTPIYDAEYDKSGNPKSVKISYYKLIDWLKGRGYRRLDVGKTYFTIHVNDNVIMECDENAVIDAYETYLDQFEDWLPDHVQKEMVLEKVYAGLGKYFSKKILDRLTNDKPISIQQHSKQAGYFYYQNGFVEVTAEGSTFKPYTELDGVIWGNQILNRDYHAVPADQYENCNYAKFVKNISNYWQTRFYDGVKNDKPDFERYQQFKSIIGNGLHSYFEGKLKAVIFTDARISDAADGRTGKTLIMKALGQMLNVNKHATTYVELNGKDFDPADRFKYQGLMIDTRLVHLNDAKRNMDIETLFNDITEGIVCQKKNEQPFTVPAKMYISTNKLIKLHGGSAKDRAIEFELADYYKAGEGPDKEFEEWFFTDWSKEDWNNFDNFMISCLQEYLKNGLQEAKGINLEQRKMIEETAPEFVQFMADHPIGDSVEASKGDMYHAFIRAYPDFDSSGWFRQRTLTKWLRLYAEYHPKIESIHERRSNGNDYFHFVYKTAEAKE